MITRVEDQHGTVLEENRPEETPVMRKTTAYVVTSMMQSVVDEGTATAVRQVGYVGPAAGKTGTTDDYTDNWFIGFSPNLSCGVWVGFDQKRPVYKGATGGTVCAPIWGEFMKAVQPESMPADEFAVPDSILSLPVCEATGSLATPACPRVRQEVFVVGAEPRTPCVLHSRP